MRKLSTLLAAVLVGAVLGATPAEAQFGKLKDKVKKKVEQRVDERTDEAAEKAVDAADPTDGGSASSPSAPAAAATADGAAAAPAAAPADAKPGEGVWANYDFQPGERVMFTEDFARDNVGDFPRRLEFIEGNAEVVEWKGARWLRATTDGALAIPLPEVLPERFTVELDHVGTSWSWPHLTIRFDGENEDPRKFDRVTIITWDGGQNRSSGGVFGQHGATKAKGQSEAFQDVAFPVRIMVDGKYVKVYMGGTRVANVPNADLGRANRIVLEYDASTEKPAFIGNIRVAAGGRKLYDALAAEGRVATQGIYFDTGSDRLRPESTPTLKEIGQMLKEHTELRLAIEGHTDNVGQAASNQALSEKRAAAVRQHLIDTYGIDASRLEAKGLGQTKPVAANETPEGRQSNRRVELVRL